MGIKVVNRSVSSVSQSVRELVSQFVPLPLFCFTTGLLFSQYIHPCSFFDCHLSSTLLSKQANQSVFPHALIFALIFELFGCLDQTID